MADTIELKNIKIEARKNASKKRNEIFSLANSKTYKNLEDNFFNHFDVKNMIVAGFLPIGSEIDITSLLERVILNGGSTCLPCVVADEQPLVFRKWKNGDNLIVEKFKTKAPSNDAEIMLPDIIITPMLAFDDKKYRLGYGGGFYDRTLPELRKKKTVTIIGVAFDEQKIDAVPIGEFDYPLDIVITQKNIYK